MLTLLGKDRSKRIAIVGHQPDLSALLTACLRRIAILPIEMKKNAVACLSFEGRAAPAARRSSGSQHRACCARCEAIEAACDLVEHAARVRPGRIFTVSEPLFGRPVVSH